jgi:NTP pyrophosphatase (non-canonical NTP hydrolase)
MKAEEICENAIRRFGITAQTLKLIEELGELTRAASRWLNEEREDYDEDDDEANLCEEIIDVEILLQQIKSRLNPVALDFWRTKKLLRLQAMLERSENPGGIVDV